MSSKKNKNEVVISEFRPEDMPLSCSWIVIGPPGSGKCLAKDTDIMMFNGAIKKVQNIKTGDFLMGDDSTPRKVLSTCKGSENLYRITQISEQRDTPSLVETYVVNESHILSLKTDYGDVKDISITDYLKSKGTYYGYKTGIDFLGTSIEIDPYLFGIWVSIGIPYEVHLSPYLYDLKKDIVDLLFKYGLNSEGEDILKLKRINGDKLSYIEDAFFQKRIPFNYMKNSRSVRLSLLAGIIDSTGELTGFGAFFIKSMYIGTDLIYLIKSLGLHCNYTLSGYTYNIYIYGNVCDIPVKLIKNKPLRNHHFSGCRYSLTIESIGIGKYYGFELNGNRRFLLGDFTVTHNTTFMENMAYYRKHVYPTARVFMGTEDGYKRMCKIFHPLYVSNYWDEDEESKHVLRQKTCEMKNGRGYPGNYAVNLIDDVSDDPKIYKTKLMRGLFKLGSQHYAQLLMIGSQYAIDMPPDIRKAVSYVAIGREPEEIERKKLYDNFGGLAGSYNKFCDLMDQLTGDYTFLIFKKRSQSNNIEECIFWFKTKQLGDWKFGCKEYRAHAEERYDKNYVEQIMM